MASVLVVYADGGVQLVEKAGSGSLEVERADGWLGVPARYLCWSGEMLGRGLWSMDDPGNDVFVPVIDVVDEWAAVEGVLAVMVNGVTVWPWAPPAMGA